VPRIINAGLVLLALAIILAPVRAPADEAAPVASQADAIPEPAASSNVYKPPPRGAPANRVGAATRDLSAQRRVALVIGNGAYQHLPRLENPVSDAKLIAKTLQSLGFQLIGGQAQTDLDRAGFERAIRQFGKELTGGSVGLFYYAGHGLQFQGANFLVPVTADPVTAADVDFELIDANTALKQMEASGSELNLVILDACRNNPFGGRGLRDAGQGLAVMRAPRGTLISYATQPGNVAMDGTTGHSPYTAALAEMVHRPGLPVLEVFNDVGLAVDQATGGRQQPWVSSSPLEGVFYFLGPTTVNITPPAPAQPSLEAETVFWQSIAQSSNAADFDEYLRQYPEGRFAGLAHNRLAALRPPPEPTMQQAPLAPASPPSIDQHDTARQLQTELQRVGCFSGKTDGIWDRRSVDAVKRFNQHAHTSLNAEVPAPEAIAAVHADTARVCPLTCSRGQTSVGDRCVALQQPRLPAQRAEPTPHATPSAPTVMSSPPAPVRGAAGPTTGADCFTFNNQRVCQ
jgi:uncharacterized caspase-like protein